jgi:hypothetical protein|tara:strand:- start:50 stop:277 length:228 start_codon:yes stop_codon:yes gene_type:complete
MGQVRKVRGLKKKIVNAMPKEGQTPQDFCYILRDQGSMPLRDFLAEQDIDAKDCGLVRLWFGKCVAPSRSVCALS